MLDKEKQVYHLYGQKNNFWTLLIQAQFSTCHRAKNAIIQHQWPIAQLHSSPVLLWATYLISSSPTVSRKCLDLCTSLSRYYREFVDCYVIGAGYLGRLKSGFLGHGYPYLTPEQAMSFLSSVCSADCCLGFPSLYTQKALLEHVLV